MKTRNTPPELHRAYHAALIEARLIGMSLKYRPHDADVPYVLTRTGSPHPLYMTDDIADVRDWLRKRSNHDLPSRSEVC